MICFEDGGDFRVEALCLHSQMTLSGLGRVSSADGTWEQPHSPESFLYVGASKEWPGKPELCQVPDLTAGCSWSVSFQVSVITCCCGPICVMGFLRGALTSTFSPSETSLRRILGLLEPAVCVVCTLPAIGMCVSLHAQSRQHLLHVAEGRVGGCYFLA